MPLRPDRPLVAVVVLLAASLVGCEARLALGATCVRTGECDSPLVCVLGRCRSECLDDVDCALGAHCVAAGGGGACTLDSEERCTASVCPSPLACVGDRCRSGCTSDGDCLASQRCEATSCVSRGGGTDAGTSDGGPFVAPTPCSGDPECGPGRICASDTFPSICRRACTAHDDCALPSACDYHGDLSIDGGYVLACSSVCLPGTGDGCAPTLTCRPVQRSIGPLPGGPSVILICDEFESANVEGCPCPGRDSSARCAAGLLCDGDPGACVRICVLGEDCEPGVPCESDERSITVAGVPYGVCPPPSVPPTSCAP